MHKPTLIRVPLTVGTPGATYDLTRTLPDWARLGAVGLSIYPLDALADHQVTLFEHNEYRAVTKFSSGGTDYGVPLGHIASYLGAESYLDGTRRATGNRLKLWPGRLAPAGMPCEQGVSLLPLKGNREIRISVARLFGSTSISKAYLWCVPLDAEEHKRRCDGLQSVVDRPHWLAGRISQAAAASSVPSLLELPWDSFDDRALRWMQTFATVYVNTAGTLSYDPTYADATYLRLRDPDDALLYPDFADGPDRISELASAGMQSFDCLRDMQLFVPPKRKLRIYSTGDATAQVKDVRLSIYGPLVNAAEMTGRAVA